MFFRFKTALAIVACLGVSLISTKTARAEDDSAAAEIRAAADQMVKAFNAAKADDMAAIFTAKGEMIDEEGHDYQGRTEIADVLTKFFQKFSGAKLTLQIESIRTVGPNLAIEEGTRYISAPVKEKENAAKDAKENAPKENGANGAMAKAQLRYTAVRTKVDGKWMIASLREFADDPTPTPHERLESLGWLVGDWVNEGGDKVVKISYRWSDDGNYLLSDYSVTVGEKGVRKTTQRVGWDPAMGKIHSWLFDSDGGFSEGIWTMVDDDWVIKASTVNPDGQAATATITLSPKGKDRYEIQGTDRIVGDSKEPDFELTVTRSPPPAKK